MVDVINEVYYLYQCQQMKWFVYLGLNLAICDLIVIQNITYNQFCSYCS